MKRTRKSTSKWLPMMILGAALLLIPSHADAQKRTVRGKSKTTVRQLPNPPSVPTPLNVRERHIKDLLYFPYGCLPSTVDNKDKAMDALTEAFGTYEAINNLYIGLHISQEYDFTYRDASIGVVYVDWYDNRHWYNFYLNTKAEADQLYNQLVKDIKNVGIPLTNDRVYGGMSNRRNPISIFKWVYVSPPTLIKEADTSNIHGEDAVGLYTVELGVYKRAAR